MAREQYLVVFHESQWKISHKGKERGPYDTRNDAIRVAIDAAHKAGEKGNDAEVLVQGADRKFRTEWTYGADPYPLQG